LEDALCDGAHLQVTCISGEFAAQRFPVGLGFAVEMLVAGTVAARGHGRHPEVMAPGAHAMDRLLEGRFDFEAQPVAADNIERSSCTQFQVLYMRLFLMCIS